MKRKVEFIESYIKVGNDYQWNDNHGELIRCKDCKHRYNGKDDSPCELLNMPLGLSEDFYCMFAERKEE